MNIHVHQNIKIRKTTHKIKGKQNRDVLLHLKALLNFLFFSVLANQMCPNWYNSN